MHTVCLATVCVVTATKCQWLGGWVPIPQVYPPPPLGIPTPWIYPPPDIPTPRHTPPPHPQTGPATRHTHTLWAERQ